VQETKVQNSGWWRHLELLLHFEVLKKSYFYNIFFYELMLSNPKFRVAVVQWSNACLQHFTSAIPGSIPGVGTNISLGLLWVPFSLAIVIAMTSLC
jgi:hypothetical protein